jgi:hypothetical protein
MSESELTPEAPEVGEPQPLIEVVHTATCPSVSGRSNLTFAVGRHIEDASLHLKIVSNDGGGKFYDGWAPGDQIDALVIGVNELTSKSFHVLHPGRSINTGGFVLASLKHLGLIRTNAENTRLHEHVPATTFTQMASAVMTPVDPASTKGRKPLRLKKGAE